MVTVQLNSSITSLVQQLPHTIYSKRKDRFKTASVRRAQLAAAVRNSTFLESAENGEFKDTMQQH